MKNLFKSTLIWLTFINFCHLAYGSLDDTIAWPQKSHELKLIYSERKVENMTMESFLLQGPVNLVFDSLLPYTAKRNSTTHSISFVNSQAPSIKMSIDIFSKNKFMRSISKENIQKYTLWLQESFQTHNFKIYNDADFTHTPFLMLNEFPSYITWSKLNSKGKEMMYRQYFIAYKNFNIVVSIESPPALFDQAHGSMHRIWAFSQYQNN